MPRYRIDPGRSKVWIEARSNVHPIHSDADGLEGFIDLETDGRGDVDLSVPPVGKLTLPVVRLSSGNRLEERELQRRIDARRYPTIVGELTHMEALESGSRYRVAGDVTFRGVVKRCEDDMTVRLDAATLTLTLEGASRFDIRDFGMEPPRILLLRVEPDVEVRVEIIATKEG